MGGIAEKNAANCRILWNCRKLENWNIGRLAERRRRGFVPSALQGPRSTHLGVGAHAGDDRPGAGPAHREVDVLPGHAAQPLPLDGGPAGGGGLLSAGPLAVGARGWKGGCLVWISQPTPPSPCIGRVLKEGATLSGLFLLHQSRAFLLSLPTAPTGVRFQGR